MASIANDPGGRRRILFVDPSGERKTIRLGKVSQRHAEGVKVRIELLLASKLTGQAIDLATAQWVSVLEPTMTDKLARVGLIVKKPPKTTMTLKAFIDEYVAGRSDIKDRSISRIREAGQKLIDCFGPNRDLRDFHPGDGDKFRQWLLASDLAENTVRRNCGRAKQFFRAAIRRKIVVENPYADLVSAVRGNPARLRFIDRATAAKVIEACPDAEWRLIFALSRFGGVRCPSETLTLRWTDVDWAKSRVRIPSPKTEHIEGKESRIIPLFPELRPYLKEAWEQAAPGAEFVITHYRSIKQNLGTQLSRIVRRAGLEPWPKLFQNLRSTRETELMETHPAHVVCTWIGNSEAVARRHYLQVTDDHFERAIRGDGMAAQKAAQQAHADDRGESHDQGEAYKKTPGLPVFATSSDYLPLCTVPLRGFELTAHCSGNEAGTDQGNVNSDARSISDLGGLELEQILLYLASLKPAERAALMGLLRTLGRGEVAP